MIQKPFFGEFYPLSTVKRGVVTVKCTCYNTEISLELIPSVKGTVSRDFLLLVFFMNQFPPSPRVSHSDRFEFFRKFAEIFVSKGAPPVSTLSWEYLREFLKKIPNDPNGILRGLGEIDS